MTSKKKETKILAATYAIQCLQKNSIEIELRQAACLRCYTWMKRRASEAGDSLCIHKNPLGRSLESSTSFTLWPQRGSRSFFKDNSVGIDYYVYKKNPHILLAVSPPRRYIALSRAVFPSADISSLLLLLLQRDDTQRYPICLDNT